MKCEIKSLIGAIALLCAALLSGCAVPDAQGVGTETVESRADRKSDRQKRDAESTLQDPELAKKINAVIPQTPAGDDFAFAWWGIYQAFAREVADEKRIKREADIDEAVAFTRDFMGLKGGENAEFTRIVTEQIKPLKGHDMTPEARKRWAELLSRLAEACKYAATH